MNHAQLRLRTGLLYQLSQLTPSPWVGSILGKSLRQVLSCWRRTASEYTRKGSFWLSAKYLSKTKVQREFLENIQSELWIQIRIIFLSWIRIQERKNWEKKQKKCTEIGNNWILLKFVSKYVKRHFLNKKINYDEIRRHRSSNEAKRLSSMRDWW